MADVDVFARSYLFVDIHQPASADTVAELLEAAAAALRGYGEVNVQHVAFDAGHDTHSTTTSLTIYYDRVERRRHDRVDGEARHPSQNATRSLRPVD